MPFLMKTQKGDKLLSLVLLSLISRWFKYVLLLLSGIGVAIGIIIVSRGLALGTDSNSGADGDNSSPTPQSQSFLRHTNPPKIANAGKFTNIALAPLELRKNATKWASLSLEEITDDYLECDYDHDRSIHDQNTWIGMREAYISVVGNDQATVEVDDLRTFETAFRIPFEVRQSKGMGRGIFATTDVRMGEVLYDFSQSAQFRQESEFKEFLQILRPDLACDVVMWSYVQYFGEGSYKDLKTQESDLRIMTDLDPGSFCNSGNKKQGNMAWLNANGKLAVGDLGDGTTDNPPSAKITRMNGSVRQDTVKSAPLVAVRDIQEGEELLCMYGQFSEGMEIMVD